MILARLNYIYFESNFFCALVAYNKLSADKLNSTMFILDDKSLYYNVYKTNFTFFAHFFYFLLFGFFFFYLEKFGYEKSRLLKSNLTHFSTARSVDFVVAKVATRRKLPKKNIFSSRIKSLTKKQKLKVRLSKAGKVIWPGTKKYQRKVVLSRSCTIIPSCFSPTTTRLVHDGYSWIPVTVPFVALDRKVGFLAFKTRSLSPIKLANKGTDKLSMAQKSTYKIKLLKAKRKK